jgi:radical SAM protein with 4Fe4S-binding SPASM domain
MNNQDNELIESILNRTFFTSWKNQKYLEDPYKYGNYAELELQVTAACDLQCKYCYYSKYSKELYPAKISKPKTVLTNLDIILQWLGKNSLYPKIALFSGELFSTKLGFQVLNKVINWHIENKIKNGQIVIPTNFTFIFDKEKTRRIEFFLMKAAIHKIKIHLSSSVDGKYCDDNRPLRNKTIRTDEYYDDLFKFCKKWNFSFHPMIYNEKIEKWIDNFLWFQQNFEKYDIDWKSLYLLEVRNKEWTKQQLKEFYKFIRFVIKWSYEKSGLPKEEFPKFAFQNKLFNLFSMFSTTGRGIGCSIQSTMQLRLGDLTTTLCHRNSYKELNLFKFKNENNTITGIEAINAPMLITMFSTKSSNFPFCEHCSIKELCSGQCLGSMYETNKDNFIVIPTVCALEHIKVAAILDELKELNLFKSFYNFAIQKRDSLKLYDKEWGKNNES